MKASIYLDFVIYLPGDWDVDVNRQHLIRALAEEAPDCKFLCLERPVDLVTTLFLHPRKFFEWLLRRNNRRQYGENLFICRTFILLHDHIAPRFSPILWINRCVVAAQVRSLVARFGLHPDRLVSWIYDPFQEMYLGLVGERLSVYNCYDEYSAYPSIPVFRTISEIRKREKRILKRVDIVLVVSKMLLRSKEILSDNVHVVSHAVDWSHFRRAIDEATVIPEDIKNIPHPIVGFVGNVTDRIDFTLLEHISKSHLSWSLVLIGGGRDVQVLDAIAELPNIHLFGARSFEKVPDYLKAFDVCIIPYDADDPFNVNCFPLKLYEYLSTGKPIVSTDLPAVRPFDGLVRIAHDVGDFERHVAEALEEQDEDLRQRRLAVAQENSWERRAEAVSRIIEDTLKGGQL